MSESNESRANRIFEIVVAILLGAGALGGAWAGYQANQWGSSAIENFGKSSTIATRGAALYNQGVATANRDANLDIQGKQLVLNAMVGKAGLDPDRPDPVRELEVLRDMTVAKYLYIKQMSDAGYSALGYPAEFNTEDREKASQMPDEAMERGLEQELDDAYMHKVLAAGEAKFVEADKVFGEGSAFSARSTAFGIVGVMFTVTLFLAGISLVLKSNVKWIFSFVGYGSLIAAGLKLFALPWYP
jgi:hypothetical protein